MYVSKISVSNANLLSSVHMTDSKWFHESGRQNQMQRRPNACTIVVNRGIHCDAAQVEPNKDGSSHKAAT